MFFLYNNDYKYWFYLVLDLISIFFTIFSIFLSKKYNIWTYPVFIISYFINSYLTYKNYLYGSFIMKIYHIMIGLYGWFLWTNKKINITFCKKKDYIQTFILFLITCILNIVVEFLNIKNENDDNFHFIVNIIMNGLYFSSMYQMAIKKVENWIIYIISNILNILYIPIFLSSFYSIIIIFLSIEGFFFWKKEAIKSKK
ncbi:nicotinamide mononucleotide transporter family protein [Blattabacterium cuenoti]|uniref:nicotinamide mononucleotide transporter family protein n=1 Tax=Blattabacterium cuenoti TaxID=1653831 RepID=UPI00163CC1D1|nr:nicotinamide mononucleotide transporter family protein [Blattabacterium cuenoti]